MRDRIYKLSLVAAVLAVLLCGCSNNREKKKETSDVPAYTLEEIRVEAETVKKKYGSMDFSKAEIIIPEGDEIEELIFPLNVNVQKNPESFESIKANFYDNVRHLTNQKKVDEQYVTFRLPEKQRQLNIKDVTVEDLADSSHGFYLGYNDSVYSTILYGSSFMCEYAGKKISSLLPKHYKFTGYRPPEGIPVESYDIPQDSIDGVSYPLDGKEVLLADAISYAEEHLGEGYHYIASPYLDYKVCHVDVVRLEDDNCYYDMFFRAVYQGISFSYEERAEVRPVRGESVDYDNVSVRHQAVMMSGESIDYAWSSSHSYEEKEDGEVYDRFLSIEDAIRILGDTISTSLNLEGAKIELLYRTEYYSEEDSAFVDEVRCHPVYQFKFINTGLGEYPILYFNVDAETGRVEGAMPL